MKNIWNMTKKDLKIFLKDRGAITWLFILPVVFITIFSFLTNLAMGGSAGSQETDTRTRLIVVNEDPQGELSVRFLEDLDRADIFRLETDSQAVADENLKYLKVSRYLVIPANFSTDLAQGKPVTVTVVVHPDGNLAGTETLLKVVNGVAHDISLELQLLDGIRQMGEMQAGNPAAQDAFPVEKTLAQAKSQFEQSRSTPLIAISASTLQTAASRAGDTIDLSTSAVPGMTVLFVFLASTVVARSIYEERKTGCLRRLVSAPLRHSELLLGKTLPIWLLTLIQIAVIFLFGAVILPLLGIGTLGVGMNLFAWAVTSMIIALCSTSLGIMIYSLAKTEGQISGLSNALLWVAGFLGGALIPTFLIQQIPMLNVLSRFVPQSYATRAYYDILARGAGLAEVLPELGMLLVFTGIFFFIGLRRFKFE
jgi:ABC-2 type transport system permease protein